MTPIRFPLRLHPVVRSRAGGDPDGAHLPYHPAIWIVDRDGRHVLDVAPDPNDLRAGRIALDPHHLVGRASKIVAWLDALHGRIAAWADALDAAAELVVTPAIDVTPQAAAVDVGVQFSTAESDVFDRITVQVRMLAAEDELTRALEPLRDRMLRRHEAALAILRSLQEAVLAWRTTENLTSAERDRLNIDDGSIES